MREVKPEWLAALKAVDGNADLRWNATVARWEFLLSSADGIPRSQFWGWFYRMKNGKRIPLQPDDHTGLYPFRDLDDAAMREACQNLEQTFIGNRFDGAGTTRKEVMRRYRYNRDRQAKAYQVAGETFADMAVERGRRLRGAPLIHVPITLTPRGAKQ